MGYLIQGKSYEYIIPPGMIFKKMYCCKCGEKLKRKFILVGTNDNEGGWRFGFSGPMLHFSYRPRRTTEYYEWFYVCHRCGYAISYDDQKIVANYQREGGRNILNEKQISFLNRTFENDFK